MLQGGAEREVGATGLVRVPGVCVGERSRPAMLRLPATAASEVAPHFVQAHGDARHNTYTRIDAHRLPQAGHHLCPLLV